LPDRDFLVRIAIEIQGLVSAKTIFMPEENIPPRSQPMILLSEPYICNPNQGRLGEILQQADLVTEKQILLALWEQGQFQNFKIGEILALRGWIDGKTADFFADRWPDYLVGEKCHPLGYYLQEASLLTEEQIAKILTEQEALWLRFGTVAVLKGWLKQTTLDFFLRHLFPEEFAKPVHRQRRKHFTPPASPIPSGAIVNPRSTSHLIQQLQNLKITLEKEEAIEEITDEIPWID
jgi:hypothetical protein